MFAVNIPFEVDISMFELQNPISVLHCIAEMGSQISGEGVKKLNVDFETIKTTTNIVTFSWFHENGSFSLQSFNEHNLSVPEYTGTVNY